MIIVVAVVAVMVVMVVVAVMVRTRVLREAHGEEKSDE